MRSLNQTANANDSQNANPSRSQLSMTSSDEGEYGTDCYCNVNRLSPVTHGQSLVIPSLAPCPPQSPLFTTTEGM